MREDYNMQVFQTFFSWESFQLGASSKQAVFCVHIVGTSVPGFSCHRRLESISELQCVGPEEAVEEASA